KINQINKYFFIFKIIKADKVFSDDIQISSRPSCSLPPPHSKCLWFLFPCNSLWEKSYILTQIIYPYTYLCIFCWSFLIPSPKLFQNGFANSKIGSRNRCHLEPKPTSRLSHPLKCQCFNID